MRRVSTIVLSLSLLVGPPLAASLLAGAMAARPAAADQNDPRLERLFDRLADADGPREGQRIAARIWSIWYQHPNGSVEALLRAGRKALADDDLPGALIAFDDAVRKAPNFAEAWNARATANYMMGNYERSLADIRRTLALEPRHFGALAGRGLCYMKTDQPERAIQAFEDSLEIHPNQPGVRANLKLLRERVEGRSL